MDKVQLINNFYQRLKSDKEDFFQLLGINQHDILSDIKRIYLNLLNTFENIQIPSQETSLLEKRKLILKRITYMYEIISDYDKRSKYEEMGNREIDPKELDESDPINEAKDFYKIGEQAFQEKEYPKAMALFNKAIKLDPEKAAYYYKLGMCQIKAKSLRRDAHQNFRQALKLEDWNAEYHASLGWLFHLEHLNKKAEPYLRKALQLDSNNQLARKILNIIAPEPTKGFSGFLKKNLPSVFKSKK